MKHHVLWFPCYELHVILISVKTVYICLVVVIWLKYCWYGVQLYPTNQQSINICLKAFFQQNVFFLSRFENRLLRLRNLDLYSVSTAFELEKILSCHTSCETEPWFRHSCPTDGQQIRRLLLQSKKALLAMKGGISFLSLIRKIAPPPFWDK